MPIEPDEPEPIEPTEPEPGDPMEPAAELSLVLDGGAVVGEDELDDDPGAVFEALEPIELPLPEAVGPGAHGLVLRDEVPPALWLVAAPPVLGLGLVLV
jgi:hypothetical protein